MFRASTIILEFFSTIVRRLVSECAVCLILTNMVLNLKRMKIKKYINTKEAMLSNFVGLDISCKSATSQMVISLCLWALDCLGLFEFEHCL